MMHNQTTVIIGLRAVLGGGIGGDGFSFVWREKLIKGEERKMGMEWFGVNTGRRWLCVNWIGLYIDTDV